MDTDAEQEKSVLTEVAVSSFHSCSDCSNINQLLQMKQKYTEGSSEVNCYIERSTGIRIQEVMESYALFKKTVEECVMIPLADLKTKSREEVSKIKWVTIGVIVSKQHPTVTDEGVKCLTADMCDLSDFSFTPTLFICARVLRVLGNLPVGAVIGLQNPKLVQGQTKMETGRYKSFTILMPEKCLQVFELGTSKDLRRCIVMHRNGKQCPTPVNWRLGKCCKEHKHYENHTTCKVHMKGPKKSDLHAEQKKREEKTVVQGQEEKCKQENILKIKKSFQCQKARKRQKNDIESNVHTEKSHEEVTAVQGKEKMKKSGNVLKQKKSFLCQQTSKEQKKCIESNLHAEKASVQGQEVKRKPGNEDIAHVKTGVNSEPKEKKNHDARNSHVIVISDKNWASDCDDKFEVLQMLCFSKGPPPVYKR